MVASVNPLASAVGLQVLQQGGNAVDAAVAAGAVLTVVEPWSGQLGGDAFLLIRSGSTGQLSALNGSGGAPFAAGLEQYRALGGIPEYGWLAATVPGVVDAWEVALERFGSRPLGELLEPAIGYAELGFPLTDRQARVNAAMASAASEFNETAAIFFPAGVPLKPGTRLRQPDLARSLRAIQAKGAEAFYSGEIAEAIVKASKKAGGLFSARDLAEHRTVIGEPLQATYRGWTVLEQPPVSQGLVVLLALAILENFDIPPRNSADTVHLQVEANKLALGERMAFAGDPRFSSLSIGDLFSKERVRSLAQQLDRRRAHGTEPVPSGHPDTTYLCVVDEQRNIASYIHSLYGGNGVVAGDTGILLNNRMLCFSLDEKSPNCLAPGKRPMHTLNSWMLLQDGQPRYVGGTPGSFWQVQTNLQLISQLVDFKADIQAAVDAPRWTMGSQTEWAETNLSLEARFDQEVARELSERGHAVERIGEWAAGGAAQIIGLDDGMLIGAADPRPGTSAITGY
jgi:gamma-glutamyltranspeptidase/glutathione hydrolase